MITITDGFTSYKLTEVAASLGTFLKISEEEVLSGIAALFPSKERLAIAHIHPVKRTSGCSHIYNRGEKAGTRCGKACQPNGLCGSHQPRSKISKASEVQVEMCDAVLKSGQRAGQACGKPCVEDGKCSIHKKTVVVPPSPASPSPSPNTNERRQNNNTDFDFYGSPMPLEDNVEWWKPMRSTEIDGKVYKQHRTTKLLLLYQANSIQVAGLMINSKPRWRSELDNYIIEWCKKSGFV